MHPDTPLKQSTEVAALPPIPSQGQNNSSGESIPQKPGVNLTGEASVQHVVEQAKQVILNYGNDPFKLCGALGELKGRYIAEQYSIVPNSVEK